MEDKDYAALRQYLMLHCIMNFREALVKLYWAARLDL
jgi:hypothetical protein